VKPDQVDDAREFLGTVLQEQPYSGQKVQTIYYATREFNLPRNGFIRERRYFPQENLTEVPHGFLEIKINETECAVIKTRVACCRQDVGEMLSRLDNNNGLEVLVQAGLDREIVYQAMEDISPRPFLPIIETVSQRYYFGDGARRVTLDINEQCWGYFEEDRETKLLLNEEFCGRLEIKAFSGKDIEQILKMINPSGIDLIPCKSRKNEFQRLYFARMEKLSRQKALHEFTYEVPGREIETKLQVVNTENPLLLIDQIFSEATGSLIPGFGVMSGKEVVKEWEFRFINYGRIGANRIEEAMVIVIDPEFERFAVKKKSSPTTTEGSPTLVRTEVVDKYFGCFEGDLKTKILKSEQRIVGSELIEIGEVNRRKRYTYITNTTTGRNYKISVDVCQSGIHQMSQLEIEYMGRTGVLPITDSAVSEIRCETEAFALWLQGKHAGSLSFTNLTKFQWLVSLHE